MKEYYEQIEKKLINEHERYLARIKLIVNNVYSDKVKPYCVKNKCSFIAGNGTYAFFKGNNLIEINDDLKELLDINILDQSLGSLMPSN